MAGWWNPGDSVPDRWLLALEAGAATLHETCTAMASHPWPDATPPDGDPRDLDDDRHLDPLPPGGWALTVAAAHADGRITGEQYAALYDACVGPRRAAVEQVRAQREVNGA